MNSKLLKLTMGLFLASLVTSVNASAYGEKVCDQKFRKLSTTTINTLAGMICTLHPNNLTEKEERNVSNARNFVHKWTVTSDGTDYIIDGTCSTTLRYNSVEQKIPTVIHPGYQLALRIPMDDSTCDPSYKGIITPLYEKERGSLLIKVLQGQNFLNAKRNIRSVIVHFRDSGALSTNDGSYEGQRLLSQIEISKGAYQMIGSTLSPAAINEGGSSSPNLVGIGQDATMPLAQFFKQPGDHSFSNIRPRMDEVKATYIISKATDGADANKDLMTVSGFSNNDFYIRQRGLTDVLYDQKLDFRFEGGTNAFFMTGYGHQADLGTSSASFYGCTDYKYEGDQNLETDMDANKCRMRIRAIQMSGFAY